MERVGNPVMTRREEIEDLLVLLADFDAQRRYQARVPAVDVPAELFNQWDDVYRKDARTEFTHEEWAALEAFSQDFERIARETPRHLPPLEQCINSRQWTEMQQAASATLTRLRHARSPAP